MHTLAARHGISLFAWEDGMAGHDDVPVNLADWKDGTGTVYIHAFNNPNRGHIAHAFANEGYKVDEYRTHLCKKTPH